MSATNKLITLNNYNKINISVLSVTIVLVLYIYCKTNSKNVISLIEGSMRKPQFQKGTASRKSLGTADLRANGNNIIIILFAFYHFKTLP